MIRTAVRRGSIIARVFAALGLLSITAGQSLAAVPATSSVPVSFEVVNQNRSNIACLADGKPYTIRGHLVGPTAALSEANPGSVTTYLHGIGWGEFYWHFTALPDYDYATLMAQQGHISLVYDQLGYGASGRSLGLLNCYGSEAQVAQQIVNALRSGTYTAEGFATAPRFTRVALASNQAAGLVAEPAAYSFRNVDALIITSFVDVPAAFKPAFALQSAPYFAACALGGERSDGTTGPRFYEFYPRSAASFGSVNFANAAPAVIAAATAARGRSPCGEGASAFTTLSIDSLQLLLRQVRVPVLLVNGLEDDFFTQPLGGNLERLLFRGSSDVTAEFIANAGQALTMERSAPDFRRVMHEWLAARGF